MMGGELVLLGALFCALGAPLLLFGGGYVALRSWRRSSGGADGDGAARARATLHARLARGEIDVEEYYERESALRSSEPGPAAGRRFT